MPKKRNSTESEDDKQANESSGSLSQSEDNAKRANLDLPSDTTLQDLPIEMLELILIKAVVMEVKGLKLAKCAWKEKADPIISRLRSVCSQWSNILTSDHFQAELHRTLNDTAQDTIPLEVLQELSVKHGIHRTVTLKDEIFTLREVRKQYYAIDVYDSDDMEEAKDVIKLPKSYVKCMTACNASNCLYVGLLADQLPGTKLSVLRIWRDADHKFKKSPWNHVYGRTISMLSVTANGCLLTFTGADWNNPASVAIHDASDALQLEVFLPQTLGDCRSMSLLQKSNGNLVVSCFDDRVQKLRTNLLEITTTGSVVRQYESSHPLFSRVYFADDYGRIMITESSSQPDRVELLDSEFNLLGVYYLQED